jgi:hypothetical protein
MVNVVDRKAAETSLRKEPIRLIVHILILEVNAVHGLWIIYI